MSGKARVHAGNAVTNAFEEKFRAEVKNPELWGGGGGGRRHRESGEVP